MIKNTFPLKRGRSLHQSAEIILVLLSAFVFAGLAQTESSQQKEIRVKIDTRQRINPTTSNPLGNVTVKIGPQTVTTDGAGEANIIVPPAVHNVKAYLQGFVVAEMSIYPDAMGGMHGGGPAYSPEGNFDLSFLYRTPYEEEKYDYTLTLYLKPGELQKQPERLPIIFLPGVAGTEIKDAGTGNQVWPLVATVGPLEFGGNRFKMMLDRDGMGSAERVRYGDILRSGLTNFYGSLMSFLTSKGYKERTDLFTLPYDWRLDLDSQDHFNRLDQLINEVLQNTGAKKVILLAHSMGGIIARAYLILRPSSAAKVDSLISMGTPYWGSVKPYYGLVDGYDFGNPDVTNKTMKILARNFPAAHFLLPQLPFIVDTNGKQLSLDESFSVQYKGYVKGSGGIDDYSASDGLIWNINSVLMDRAKKFWEKLGTITNPVSLPLGIKHYVIIGYGNRTLNGYQLKPSTDDDYFAIGSRKVKAEPIWGDGDITVPLELAQIKTATKTYYVRFKQGAGGSKIGRVSSQHGDLPANPSVQSLVWQIIEGKPNDGSLYGYSKPGASEQEYVDFTLHSDAHLSITDEASGERLGFNSKGGIDQTLPGTFLAIGEAEFASLANISDKYQVKVEGIRDGKFSLEVNIGKDGYTLAKFYYPEVPVKKGTVAQFNLSPGQAASIPPDLTVTTDGKTTTIPAIIVNTSNVVLYVLIGVIGLLAIVGLLSFLFIYYRRMTRPAFHQAGINPGVMTMVAGSPVEATSAKRCRNPQCGKIMRSENRFCSGCGAPLNH